MERIGQHMVDSQQYTRFRLKGGRRRFAIDGLSEDVSAWRTAWREALGDALGIDGGNGSAAPSATVVEVDQFPSHRREKIVLDLPDGSALPFYLLLPIRSPEGRLPVVIGLHGHSRRGKEPWAGNFVDEDERRETGETEEDVGLQAVGHGYAALIPDVRGFGEMMFREDLAAGKANSCEEFQRRALMTGATLIGERVADVSRLIDYVQTRHELDPERIMLVGHSGGGTVTLFAAALDPRITVAVPVSYFCTFQASILARHHCICNVIPGMLELGEMSDVAALVAPRPLLVVHGLHDPIYPFEATKAAFWKVLGFYRKVGVTERVQLAEGAGGHRFYAKPVWDFAARFL